MKGTLLLLAIAIPALLLAELFFLSIIYSDPQLEKADLIAVFTGGGIPIGQPGLQHQSDDFARVSPRAGASSEETQITPIVEPEARTTVEDAINTRRITVYLGQG